MKSLTDYIFYNSWQEKKLGIKTGDRFKVIIPIGKLNINDEVTYVGYDDVDNHYGIFVFKNNANEPLEIGQDFCNISDEFITLFKLSLQPMSP